MKGLWIARWILEQKNISIQEKCFLAFIEQSGNDCTTSNEEMSKYFNLSVKRVSQVINTLKESGLIMTTIEKSKANVRIMRVLSPNPGIVTMEQSGDSVLWNNPGIAIPKNGDTPPHKLPDLPISNITKSSLTINKKEYVPDAEIPKELKEKKKKIKSEIETDGSPEWYVKQGYIYPSIKGFLISLPSRTEILTQIFNSTLAARPDKATKDFLAKYPLTKENYRRYAEMLMPYGIAKTFHEKISAYRPPETYKSIREAKTKDWIDHARLMLQEDKHEAILIKDVMIFMFDEDDFWKKTIWSLGSFRIKFDKILGKMQDVDSAHPNHH